MYRTTQPGNFVAALLLAGIALASGVGFANGWPPLALVVAGLLALVLVVFRSLTIEIDDAELRCWFGDGLIRRRLPLSEIASAAPVRNKWYYGWGVRLTPSGWMFNVSGFDAVELTFESGKRFRIGTDRPRDVIDAMRLYKPELAMLNPGASS